MKGGTGGSLEGPWWSLGGPRMLWQARGSRPSAGSALELWGLAEPLAQDPPDIPELCTERGHWGLGWDLGGCRGWSKARDNGKGAFQRGASLCVGLSQFTQSQSCSAPLYPPRGWQWDTKAAATCPCAPRPWHGFRKPFVSEEPLPG